MSTVRGSGKRRLGDRCTLDRGRRRGIFVPVDVDLRDFSIAVALWSQRIERALEENLGALDLRRVNGALFPAGLEDSSHDQSKMTSAVDSRDKPLSDASWRNGV
jgi:hypothetical protein